MVGSIKSINTARARARTLEEKEEEEGGEGEACPCFLYWQHLLFNPSSSERSLFCKILYTASMERLRAEGREKGVMWS